MKRILIVNADDCNLTPGVTQAILDCHDHGILTSTTFMMNLPVERKTVRDLLARKHLGIGIHLNVTLGKPVSAGHEVRSLLASDGLFKKRQEQLGALPEGDEIFSEYRNQIRHFIDCFGGKPTHLDTHHQMHDHPLYFKALLRAAEKFRLPVRRSRLMTGQKLDRGIRTTDYFFGNLTPEGYWREEALETILKHLPEGVSEIMCHPGRVDHDLRKISSFTLGRDVEHFLFRNFMLRKKLESRGVTRAHFGLCYT